MLERIYGNTVYFVYDLDSECSDCQKKPKIRQPTRQTISQPHPIHKHAKSVYF